MDLHGGLGGVLYGLGSACFCWVLQMELRGRIPLAPRWTLWFH